MRVQDKKVQRNNNSTTKVNKREVEKRAETERGDGIHLPVLLVMSWTFHVIKGVLLRGSWNYMCSASIPHTNTLRTIVLPHALGSSYEHGNCFTCFIHYTQCLCFHQQYYVGVQSVLDMAQPTILTGRSTLTSVPSSRDTRQVMIDFASPAAGMCVEARWASRNRVFSACFRMERRPSVLRRKLSMMRDSVGYKTTPEREERRCSHISFCTF